MRPNLKNTLMVAASLLALGSAAPAFAFDNVEWNWEGRVDTNVDLDLDINYNLDPTGLTMVEAVQVNIGDVTAFSKVDDITNTQYNQGGNTGPITVSFSDDHIHNGQFSDNLNDGGVSGNISGSVNLGHHGNKIEGTITLTGVNVPTQAYDALTELPQVVSAATAVANNTSIESQVATNVHGAQYAGATDVGYHGPYIEPAKVKATSLVDDIINATVDSTATAVTNSMSVDLAYAVPAANITTFQGGHHHSPALDSDAVMIGDFKQVALSDTSAVSVVTDVALNKYKNLGGNFRPIVNSAATAVGNNLSISVKPVSVGN